MAETSVVERARSRTAPYRAVLGSRVRAQRSYRANFRLDLASSFAIGWIELAEIWVLFHNVTDLGGFGFAEILLVFGLAEIGFSLADLLVGHCDTLPTYLRTGTLDVFYLRPQPLLLQLMTSDISLRRLARCAVGASCCAIALVVNDIDWSVSVVVLLIVALLSSVAISAAMFVWAAGVQFFLVNGAETTNAFVYGGRYAASQPASIWNRPLKVVFGFLFPMAFSAFIPSLHVLGITGPAWMPAWLAWASPLAALWIWVLALLTWRLGVRHYQGGGG